MITRRLFPLIAIVLLLCVFVSADSRSSPQSMTKETRMLVIRSLQSEFIFAHHALPGGEKGVVLKDGKIVSPAGSDMDMALSTFGTAVKPGERAQITKVDIKDDRIIFEVNGGPKKKSRWYQHVQVGMGNATMQAPEDTAKNPHGSLVELRFDKRVPEITGDQIRQLLAPVFDFKAKSAAEAYIETVPPKVKDAIRNHQVLVGMNREMVTYAMGRAEKKIREQDDHGIDYEEWLYGQPPRDVQFVRFVGDEVVQLKIMKVDGSKIVRTEREVELPKVAEQKPEEKSAQPQTPAKKPTLKRPGEPVDEKPLPPGGVDPS